MSTRQSDCEAEIVPSLHSKRGDVSAADVSAAGAAFDATARAEGVGFCATGFCDRAQLAHKSRISKAEAVRIALHPGGYAGAAIVANYLRTSAFQLINSPNTDTTERLDSDMPRSFPSESLCRTLIRDGCRFAPEKHVRTENLRCCFNRNRGSRLSSLQPHLTGRKRSMQRQRPCRPPQQLAYQPSGNGMMSQT